jgi:iron complex outermembrane receptor protein
VYGAFGYHEGRNNQNFPSGSVDANGNISYNNPYYDAFTKTTTADVGLRAHVNTFGIGHTITVGATQVDRISGYAYDNYSETGTTNIYNPSAIPTITSRATPIKNAQTKLSSISLTDTLSIADGRLLITGGVRKQQAETFAFDTSTSATTSKYSASTYSPLLGIVVKPLSYLSVYGNYSTGLQAGSTVGATYDNANQILAPYKSKQYETGIKLDWGRVTTTAAVFQITKPNAITTGNIYNYNGEQRNRGLELAAYGEAVPGVRLMASGTFYDAKQTRTQDGTNDGKLANGVPRRTFNLGGDWDTPWLKGLSLNARAVYTSSIYVDAANTLQVPSWVRYDIGARYNTNIAGKSVVFRATVQNLLNKNYWLTTDSYGYLTVAAARTLMLSAQVDF